MAIGLEMCAHMYTHTHTHRSGDFKMKSMSSKLFEQQMINAKFFFAEVSGATAIDHVQHNHTYHMSPEGPSGINRPHARDKKGEHLIFTNYKRTFLIPN